MSVTPSLIHIICLLAYESSMNSCDWAAALLSGGAIDNSLLLHMCIDPCRSNIAFGYSRSIHRRFIFHYNCYVLCRMFMLIPSLLHLSPLWNCAWPSCVFHTDSSSILHAIWYSDTHLAATCSARWHGLIMQYTEQWRAKYKKAPVCVWFHVNEWYNRVHQTKHYIRECPESGEHKFWFHNTPTCERMCLNTSYKYKHLHPWASLSAPLRAHSWLSCPA